MDAGRAAAAPQKAKASPASVASTPRAAVHSQVRGLQGTASLASTWAFQHTPLRSAGALAPPPARIERIQRKCACGGTCEQCRSEDALGIQRMPAAAAASEPAASAGALEPATVLVDDGATVGPGQMTRSAFMATLRARLFALCDEELAPAGRSAEGCPYLTTWLAHYDAQSAEHIERAIRLYTRAAARDADGLLEAVEGRVRAAVRVWVATGEISGVPPELGLGGMVVSSGLQVVGALERWVGAAARSVSGGLLPKVETGALVPISAAGPAAVRARLGMGAALNGSARTRMESAFGHDFSAVRVHSDANAAQLSRDLNARAFTIGNDVAFASNEYRPGTLIGDALLAHELAHVVQQNGAAPDGVAAQGAQSQDSRLEEDADLSAVGAVVALWGKAAGWAGGLGDQAMPSLRAGLRLQRCGSGVCPPGFCWQVVGSDAGIASCTCHWRCLSIPTSGPVIYDPNAPRPWVPTDTRHGWGGMSADPNNPTVAGSCGCVAIEEEGRGTVCNAPFSSSPTSDFRALAGPFAEAARGTPVPPPTREARPRPAIIGPPTSGGGVPLEEAPTGPAGARPPSAPGGARPVPVPPEPLTPPGTRPASPTPTTPATPAPPARPVTPPTGGGAGARGTGPGTLPVAPRTATTPTLSMSRGTGLNADEAAALARTREYFNLPAVPTESNSRIVGMLIPEGGEGIAIHSGEFGGPSGGTHRGGIPRGAGSGADRYTLRHVEGHAAAIMRERGFTRAWLLIELPPCPACGGYSHGGADSRTPNLSSMLPRGSQLLVIDAESATYFRSTE
jgi:hypothetical protein